MRWWFFQRFEQCVESIGRQHVNLIDNVDLIASGSGSISNGVDNFANVSNAGAARGIHLHYVDMSAFHY